MLLLPDEQLLLKELRGTFKPRIHEKQKFSLGCKKALYRREHCTKIVFTTRKNVG